jgi:outer membrane protein insertion porin family
MTYSPVLFRTALTLSTAICAAAPMSAQALTASRSESSNLSETPALPGDIKQTPTPLLAQSPTDPSASPTQVFPLPKTSPSPEATPSPQASPSPEATPSPAPTPPAPAPAGGAGSTEVVPPPPPTGAPATGEPGTPPTETPLGQAVPELPGTPPPNAPTSEDATPQAPERQVLVSEVLVEGAQGELADKVYEAISTRPGQPTTRSQLQVDINAIFATGYFSAVRAEPSDTPLWCRPTPF